MKLIDNIVGDCIQKRGDRVVVNLCRLDRLIRCAAQRTGVCQDHFYDSVVRELGEFDAEYSSGDGIQWDTFLALQARQIAYLGIMANLKTWGSTSIFDHSLQSWLNGYESYYNYITRRRTEEFRP